MAIGPVLFGDGDHEDQLLSVPIDAGGVERVDARRAISDESPSLLGEMPARFPADALARQPAGVRRTGQRLPGACAARESVRDVETRG